MLPNKPTSHRLEPNRNEPPLNPGSSRQPRAAAGLNVAQLVRRCARPGSYSTANLDAVEGLGVMHTMAVLDTNGERLEPARAREFVALAEAVLYALRSQARP